MSNIIITDLHEDFYSLQTFFALKKSPDNISEIYSLGDNIGFSIHYKKYQYRRDADRCIELLRKNNVQTIIGNHELNFLKKNPNIPFFIYPESWYHLDKEEKFNCSNKSIWLYQDEFSTCLEPNNMHFVENMNDFIIKNNILYSHFLYPDFNGTLILRKVLINKLLPIHFVFMSINKIGISFIGHTHIKNPTIISSDGSKKELNIKEKEIYLDPQINHVVFCPPMNSYVENTIKYLSYCEVTRLLIFYSFECRDA